ncbi:MAG TPA: hypothetical protein RMH85_14665 [Polyangiaceae bacterium LLY-WYZ-15_(1-7)]|nr:hypothetical protein [Myxococcales bacterium]MAT26213.1 hypothetical protein [Sandaracinus sp.]HJK94918.1 hypothetical protein [Polyangiaceae bacterium LLY-WYZ-15_(1-7)]HJL02742.1 hypothetical protein [Polyangiaceae bacterium LLY-WYZ-15_(1-7)]HJL09742.1 hypothetical protein [Polyangiaceae bacterium LLY-WYZ-15_(1-7)]
MLIECAHCGAPLDVKDDERRTTCTYCGRPQEVRSARTMQQPAGWKPPAQWTPPERFPAPSRPLQHDPARAAEHARKSVRGVLWGVGCTVLLSILVPGIIVAVVVSKATDAVESVTIGGGGGGGAGGIEIPGIGVGTTSNQPLECVGPGSVIRTNAQVNVTSGPAVIVRNGCQLRLMNTSVRGKDGIRVEGDGEVTMVNGSLDVEGTAIYASGTGTLTLTNVELSGKNGIATEGTAQVRTINGGIRAAQVAIDARGDSRVTTTNTDVTGRVEQDPTATVRQR